MDWVLDLDVCFYEDDYECGIEFIDIYLLL